MGGKVFARGWVLGALLLSPAASWGKQAGKEAAGKAPVSERQRAIEADTEKLVQMAAELKVSVDRSTKNELSVEVVRKAEAVEKLAKSLKERIRDGR